jgi:hypothetical protein
MIGMGLFNFWKKIEEVFAPVDECLDHPACAEEPADVEVEHRNLGCVCALIYLFGKVEPVKATFFGTCEIDPVMERFGISKHRVQTAHEHLEAALQKKFIRVDFDFYYPTASIEKVELQCSDHFVAVPVGIEENTEEPLF